MTEGLFTLYMMVGAYIIGFFDAEGWKEFSPKGVILVKLWLLFAWPIALLIGFGFMKGWLK